MVYSQIWKDISFNTSADTVDYYIADGSTGEVVHTGYAKRMPGETGVTIDVNRIVEEYLNPRFEGIETEEDFLSIISEVVPNPDAYKNYTVNDAATSAVLETFGLLYDWSYEDDWNGENGHNMSNPINGRIDPRMKIFISDGNTAETSYQWDIGYDPGFFGVSPSAFYFPYVGGNGQIYVNSKGNWSATTDSNWYSIDITSHTGTYVTDTTVVNLTVTSTDATTNRNGAITFTNDEGDTAIVKVYQYGIILYVEPVSGSYDWQGGTRNVAVYYNVPFTISTDSNWLTPEYGDIPQPDSSGRVLRYDIQVRASENSTGWTRTGVITFASTSVQATFTGTQEMRLDNKVIYKSPRQLYPYMTAYSECGDEWGADYLTGVYDSNTDIGMLVFDNTVTKYNGLTDTNTPGVRPTIIPLEWVWMYRGVTRINGRGIADDQNNRGIAFAGDTALTAVVIDDHYYEPSALTLNGIAALPNACFINCWSLTEFNAWDSLRTIGATAFATCSTLTSINLNKVTAIGAGAFNDCSALTSVVIPDSVTTLSYVGEGSYTLGTGCFMNCSSLTGATIGRGLSALPDYTFTNSGLRSMTVPSNIQSIGANCFNGCSELTSVTLNNGLETIGVSAFTDCTALTSVNIPASVKEIDGEAFSGCSSLSTVTLDGPTEFYAGVFKYCTSLTNVVISDNTTRLGEELFLRCTALTSVTIGAGVTTMKWSAGGFDYGRQFAYCSSLREIYAKPRTAPAIYEAFDGVAETGVLHYPAGSDYSAWISALPSGWTAVADL